MFDLKMVGMSVLLSWAAALPGKMTTGMNKGLSQAAQHWLSQHKARWIKQESPEGKRWAPNNRMWAEVKGQSTPLTGITQGTTRTWNNIKFTGNSIHMRSALKKRVTVDTIEFYYPQSVKARALATQEGKTGAILTGMEDGKERRFIFNIPARPHTGIGPNDAKAISDTFDKEIGEALL
jgi:phage gpG-like protein